MQTGSTLETVTASVLTPAEKMFLLEKLQEKKVQKTKRIEKTSFHPKALEVCSGLNTYYVFKKETSKKFQTLNFPFDCLYILAVKML